MAIIRALTFFIPLDNNAPNLEKSLNEYLTWVDNITSDFPYKPWTVRLVLPPIPSNYPFKKWRTIIEYIAENINLNTPLIHGLTMYLGDKRLKEFLDILKDYKNLFANFLYVEEYHDDLDLIYSFEDPDIYTRIAFTFGQAIETPYFPATTNKNNIFGFALALRYIDLMDIYLNGDKKKLVSYLDDLEMKLSVYGSLYLGIDLSLSPWMDESVAKLIEDRLNVKVGQPGSYHAISKLNNIIMQLIRGVGIKTIGFNEVMLPVGEDNRLMELAKDGQLKLIDLIGLTNVCVAGLDMVVIPDTTDLIKVIAKDLYSISVARKKSLGMRLIPTSEDEVYIARFGTIPKIRVT